MSDSNLCGVRSRQVREYHDLIHGLNQRYQAAFDRAERLDAELNAIKQSRSWQAFDLMRTFRRWFRRGQPAAPLPASFAPLRILEEPRTVPTDPVSIVIPFRDRVGLLRGCLHSLEATDHPDYEIILVDNGSEERATRQFLRKVRRGRMVRVVHQPGPFNFSRLCNAGACLATGEYLLFLNNDIEALDPGWLEALLRPLADPAVGIVGGTLLYPDGRLQHTGLFPQPDGNWTHAYRGFPENHTGDQGELACLRAVPAVTGACLLTSRSLFNDLGGFDERLPLTYNDVDLCCRARADGHLVAVTPHARLIHFESLSRGYVAEPPASTLLRAAA